MYRTDFQTLWEKARVGCFKRTASKCILSENFFTSALLKTYSTSLILILTTSLAFYPRVQRTSLLFELTILCDLNLKLGRSFPCDFTRTPPEAIYIPHSDGVGIFLLAWSILPSSLTKIIVVPNCFFYLQSCFCARIVYTAVNVTYLKSKTYIFQSLQNKGLGP